MIVAFAYQITMIMSGMRGNAALFAKQRRSVKGLTVPLLAGHRPLPPRADRL
jgi:hypothetical protein